MLKVKCDTCMQLDTLFDDALDKVCPVVVTLRQMAITGRQKSLLSELAYSRISTSSPEVAISFLLVWLWSR